MLNDFNMQMYKAKTKFAMVGPVSAGKSTVVAGLVYDCSLISATDPNFFCRIHPNCTQIISDANALRNGRFPKKTDPLAPNAPISGIVIGEKGYTEKTAMIPIMDIAGEITDYVEAKADGNTPYEQIRKYMQSINTQVVNQLQDCTGIFIMLDATKALMFRDNFDVKDDDTYTYNVINSFMQSRRQNHKDDPYIIAVLTKWDKVSEMAKAIQMDVYDTTQNGLERFLANGFPMTYMLLKPLREKGKVKYFKTWFKLKKRESDGTVETWEDGTPRIAIKQYPNEFIRHRPDCSEEDLTGIIHHVMSFA
jgi:hypothetical protein